MGQCWWRVRFCRKKVEEPQARPAPRPPTQSRTRACQPTAAHHAFPPRTFPATHMPFQPLQRMLELRYPVVGAVGRSLQVHVGHPQHLQPRLTGNVDGAGIRRTAARATATAWRQLVLRSKLRASSSSTAVAAEQQEQQQQEEGKWAALLTRRTWPSAGPSAVQRSAASKARLRSSCHSSSNFSCGSKQKGKHVKTSNPGMLHHNSGTGAD